MSNEQNTDKDFPGYPHYPAKDDITNNEKEIHPDRNTGNTEEARPDSESENDINAEDLAALEQEDRNVVATRLDNTDADGTPLNEDGNAKNMGNDLDVPGAELDDANEAIGEEDEENNYYSESDNDTTEDTQGIP